MTEAVKPAMTRQIALPAAWPAPDAPATTFESASLQQGKAA
jgi:hypothetical protein